MITPKKTTWVLVADGARARILANEGPKTGLVPVPGTARDEPVPKSAELGSDRPGRSFATNRVGGGDGSRSAMEPRVDWHEFQEQKFAKKMAAILDAAATHAEFDHLVLVAPPKTLGDLRASLNDHTRAKVSGELAKDLTKHSLADLPGHLDGLMRL
jgi:protein required for attachment to host cells